MIEQSCLKCEYIYEEINGTTYCTNPESKVCGQDRLETDNCQQFTAKESK